MKVVILAGGFGTRISEESHLKPKPMIEIGDKPILWHIMKYYTSFGYNDFIICCGYKQHMIKEFFADYYLHMSDVTFDFQSGVQMTIHNNSIDPWKVTLVDTGLNTMTGGRIRRIKDYIDESTFMLTYGDGLSDVDIAHLIDFHKHHKRLATITAIRPGGRYGKLEICQEDDTVKSFQEKAVDDGGWVNGGFMILDSRVIDYIEGDNTIFERAPLEKLASEGSLTAYKHYGFWQCMDTLRDKDLLDKLWITGKAPWKRWN